VRLFVSDDLTEATFRGSITNQENGVISSEQDAGILIESGLIFEGQIINDGTIVGNRFAIDANDALGSVDVTNRGLLVGTVRLGQGNDRFVQLSSVAAIVQGGAGNDLLDASLGAGANILLGGRGDDTLIAGSGDRLFGGIGNDVIITQGSNNILTGNGGNDRFAIVNGAIPDAVNTITDFRIGVDQISIGGIGATLTDLTFTQLGGNTLISFSNSDLAVLLGVNATSLAASNSFIFS
jgi:Ca2+-binding RTX toxin-like protein